jgi:hypothetical protein
LLRQTLNALCGFAELPAEFFKLLGLLGDGLVHRSKICPRIFEVLRVAVGKLLRNSLQVLVF